MRAMNRHVLLLKDIRMPKMPSDMTGKLHRSFASSLRSTSRSANGQNETSA